MNLANQVPQMERRQRLMLLPRFHPRNLSGLLKQNVSHPRIRCLHAIRCLLLATILLHRQDWSSLDGHLVINWLCHLHGCHCRLSSRTEIHQRSSSGSIHVPLPRLLHARHLACLVELQRRDSTPASAKQSHGCRCFQPLDVECEYPSSGVCHVELH